MKQRIGRKFSIFTLIIFLLTSNILYASTYKKEMTIIMNDKKIETDVAPEIKRDVAFVPISFIAKELEATVIWDKPFITLIKDDITLTFELGKFNVLRNNEKYNLEEAPYILKGRTMIPLRAISEHFGCRISYDNATKRIDINSKATIPFTPPVDSRRYYTSEDEKWGLAYKEDYMGNEVVYLKNMETNDIVELMSGYGMHITWLTNTQIFCATKSGNIDEYAMKHDTGYPCGSSLEYYNLDIYDVETKELIPIAHDIIFYKYLESEDIICYEFRNEEGQIEYRQYDVATKELNELAEEVYEALLK